MDHELFLRFLLKKVKMVHKNNLYGVSRYYYNLNNCSNNRKNWEKELEYIYQKYNIDYNRNIFNIDVIFSKILRYLFLIIDNKRSFKQDK